MIKIFRKIWTTMTSVRSSKYIGEHSLENVIKDKTIDTVKCAIQPTGKKRPCQT